MDGQAREIEDIGDDTMTFGELKAAAAGNDLLRRQHELESRVRSLRLAHLTVGQNVRTLLHQGAYADKVADAAAARVARLEAFAEHRDAMADIDLAGVAEDVCAGRGGNRYLATHRVRLGDHLVAIDAVDTEPGRRLELDLDHRALWSEPLPGKVRRRGPNAVKAWAEAMVAAWVAGLDREIVATRGRAAESARRAQESRDTAAATDISEPGELIAACAELDAVNAEIKAALNETEAPAAAA